VKLFNFVDDAEGTILIYPNNPCIYLFTVCITPEWSYIVLRTPESTIRGQQTQKHAKTQINKRRGFSNIHRSTTWMYIFVLQCTVPQCCHAPYHTHTCKHTKQISKRVGYMSKKRVQVPGTLYLVLLGVHCKIIARAF
jgi:hypothetical protein